MALGRRSPRRAGELPCPMDLIFGSRKLEGALTGDPATDDATLRFSALSGICPDRDCSTRARGGCLREDDGSEGALSHGTGHEERCWSGCIAEVKCCFRNDSQK
jgi:hypothetical protein